MKFDGWEGYEDRIRDKFCWLCGELIRESGFSGCEESDHPGFIEEGYDFCPYCGKDLTPHIEKFLDLKVRLCRRCGKPINRDRYVTCFGSNHIPGNPKDANFCKWCGKKLLK